MKISREDVLRVAELAYLDLSDTELETYRAQIDEILEYIGKLNELDTSKVEPMAQVLAEDQAADATRDDDLREAGVLRAKGLIAALPSDAENLFIILSAKTLNPKLTVVTRVSEEEAGEKLHRAGADTVFTPYAMAGRQLADALLRPHVVEFLDAQRMDRGFIRGLPRTLGARLGRAGFEDYDAIASSLSGGWRKRLAIA